MARIYYWIGCGAYQISILLDWCAFAFADGYQWAMGKSRECYTHNKVWTLPPEEEE